MAGKKHERSAARASAAALLYSADIIEEDAISLAEQGRYPAEDFELSEYAESLVRGVTEKQSDIDGYLKQTSENWSLDRMPYMDRAILRLAVYEMLFADDVPISVAIDEAVELAKTYGGEDESSRFVNGVLGKIARMIEGADEGEAEAEADAQAQEPAKAEEGTDGE